MPTDAGALMTAADYAKCARDASPMVKRVIVKCRATDPNWPLANVEVRVYRRFLGKLPARELRKVHHAIAAANPIGVALKVK